MYSTSAELVFDFNRYHNREDTLSAIDSIQYPGEKSDLISALGAMKTEVLPTATDGLPKVRIHQKTCPL